MSELETSIDQGVGIITFNRPKALNAVNHHVMAELLAAAEAFDKDPDIGCIVLTGAGDKAFVAGADIVEMADKSYIDMQTADIQAGWQRFAATRTPMIAAVNGFALGGGCEIAMMCDIIIASDKAKFGQPEIKLGVAPGMGGSQRLTRAVGKAKAMDMCLTGRMMGAEEAERAGLVSRIVPAAELLDEALKDAALIAAMPPMAAMVNKEMVNIAFETGLAQGLLTERRLFQILTATEDKKEGMTAFVEKRAGVWKGR
mgnify:CR=1 FL=1